MDKLTQTGVKINTNLVWTSHNIGVLNLTPEFLNVYVSNTPLRHRFLELKGNYALVRQFSHAMEKVKII